MRVLQQISQLRFIIIYQLQYPQSIALFDRRYHLNELNYFYDYLAVRLSLEVTSTLNAQIIVVELTILGVVCSKMCSKVLDVKLFHPIVPHTGHLIKTAYLTF